MGSQVSQRESADKGVSQQTSVSQQTTWVRR